LKEGGSVADLVKPRKVREKVVLPGVRSRSVGAKVKFSEPVELKGVDKGEPGCGTKVFIKWRRCIMASQ